jgi:hypothetical protein
MKKGPWDGYRFLVESRIDQPGPHITGAVIAVMGYEW